MADYQNFIQENQSLRDYFERFPKKVMELANEQKCAKFSGEDVLINLSLLADYLVSPESIFEIQTVQDFIESMHLVGFSRSCHPEKNQMTNDVFRFVHPHFHRDQTDFPNLYKTKTNGEVKNTKRLSESCSIQLIDRLLLKHSHQKITKLDFTRMCLDFALQKQLDLFRGNPSEDDLPFEEPDYVKNNEIAGYYGNVSFEALKNAFQNYFPIYQVNVSEAEEEIPEVAGEDIILECEEEIQSLKRRKIEKPSIAHKETDQALEFLFKHAKSMSEQ